MYKSISLIFFLFLALSGFAQIVENKIAMSAGEQNALEVDLKGDLKSAEKIWKDKVKTYGKVDWDRKNKEHVLFNTIVPSVSSDNLTLVARFEEKSKMVKGAFWVKQDGAFLSSENNGETIRNLGEFLLNYSYEVERNAIRKQIESEEKGLDRLEKDLKKLEKKNSNLHRDIEKAKAEIAKKEKEIEANLQEQAVKKNDIDLQKEKISKTTEDLTNVGKSGTE